LFGALAGSAAAAQSRDRVPESVTPDQAAVANQIGDVRSNARAPQTGTGMLGQRQRREDAPENIQPLARLETRVENRIQNRLSTRLDRNFQPPTTASAPVARAKSRIESAIVPGRR
jgi:hypothetical protein